MAERGTYINERASQETKDKLTELAKSENRSRGNWLEVIIDREYKKLKESEGLKMYKDDIIIVNWKKYALNQHDDSLDMLERALIEDGWLNEKGLTLRVDGEDYRKQFWQKYDIVFDDKVIEFDD